MNHTTTAVKEIVTHRITPAVEAKQQAKLVLEFIESSAPDFVITALLDAIDEASVTLGIDIYEEDEATGEPKITQRALARLFRRARFFHTAE